MSPNEPPPDWISSLTGALTAHFTATALPAPMGAHVQRSKSETPDGIWEVSVFYGKTEIIGGPQDGHRTDTSFWLDLTGLGGLFDQIDAFYWQAAQLGSGDDFGPHVGVEGVFRGHPVRVRLLAKAPAQFPAARSADTLRGTFFDLW